MINRSKEIILKLFTNKVFRYLFSGGISAMVDILVFNVCWNWVFHKNSIAWGGMHLKGYDLSLVISYISGSLTSFFLNKFFVFAVQNQGFIQFLKSLPVYLLAFAGNFFLLDLGIENLHLDPTVSRIIAALTVAFLTFNLHKYFTFKTKSL